MTVLPQEGYYATHDADRVEEYALLVQSKNEDVRLANKAKVQLIDRNMNFLRKLVWSWSKGNFTVDFDHVIFHARVGFFDAITNYDLTRGVSIRRFAFFYLKGVRSEVFMVKEQPVEVDEKDGGWYYMPNPDVNKFNLREILCRAFDEVLTITEHQVMYAHFFEGKKQSKIASEREISEARVSTIIKTSFPKLKKYLLVRDIKPGFLELN